MSDSSLPFELSAILLLTIIGSALLLLGLPGWGLIATAFLLASMTVGLRLANVSESHSELVAVKVKRN